MKALYRAVSKAILFSAIAMAAFFIVGCGGAPGSYQPVSATDANVVKAGKFAVENATKPAGETYSFETVLSARMQVVAGYNYDLCVRFDNSGKTATAQTVVYRKPDDSLTITSWEMKTCN